MSKPVYVAMFQNHQNNIGTRDTVISLGVFTDLKEAVVCCLEYIQEFRSNLIELFPDTKFNEITEFGGSYRFESDDSSDFYCTFVQHSNLHEKLNNEDFKIYH